VFSNIFEDGAASKYFAFGLDADFQWHVPDSFEKKR
jgi:hypothetical protein